MNSGIPSYFAVDKSYQTIPVGHVSHFSVIVNDPNYDSFVLAGISKNELFSKLVMQNMNIKEGRAFDTNISNISSHLPTDRLKIITKNVSAYNTATSDNLQAIISKYKDIFLKMDVGGSEYLWILTQSSEKMFRFKQMVISFHNVNDNPTQARAINKINSFKKILETHIIANIRSHQNKLTITYIRRAVMSVPENITSIEIISNIASESSCNEADDHPIFTQNTEPVVEPVVVVPVVEEPVVQLVVEEIVPEQRVIEPTPEPVVVEEPVSEPTPEPVSEPIIVEESVSEPTPEPVAEEPVVILEESVAEEPVVVEEPVIVEEPVVVEEPVAELVK